MAVSPQRRWQNANPEKARAHYLVSRAIENGTLVRPADCSRCGAPDPHGHHEDYSKPLDVTWLCVRCHAARHRELRPKSAVQKAVDEVLTLGISQSEAARHFGIDPSTVAHTLAREGHAPTHGDREPEPLYYKPERAGAWLADDLEEAA